MKHAKPPDAGSKSALAGQDDSTLFSLRSLTKQGAPSREEAAQKRDDSGLIDLAALAAMHEARTDRPKLEVAPFVGVGLFDVPEKASDAPPPDPPPLPPEPAPARAPNRRTIALIAGAVTAVATASAIAIAAMHGPSNASLPPVTALHTATVPASSPPEPARAEAPAPTEAKPAETAAKPPPGPAQGPSRRGPKPPGSAVVKRDPPKPAAACDLMCQMQKSVAKPR